MTVEPSSALRSCTVVYLTSSRPHFGQVSRTVLSVWILCFSTACTLDCSFCLRKDGKSEGFVFVKMVFEPVSTPSSQELLSGDPRTYRRTFVFSAAAFAAQDISFGPLGRRKEVSTVSAEHQRTNCRHGSCFALESPLLTLSAIDPRQKKSWPKKSSDTKVAVKLGIVFERPARA